MLTYWISIGEHTSFSGVEVRIAPRQSRIESNVSIAWKIVFASCWRDFGSRFNSILENLARHRDLVDREALSIDIAEARVSRRLAEDELDKSEKAREILMLQNALAWLAADDVDQENHLVQLSARRQHDTCEWVLGLTKVICWMNGGPDQSVLWLRGIPGSGTCAVPYSSLIKDRLSP